MQANKQNPSARADTLGLTDLRNAAPIGGADVPFVPPCARAVAPARAVAITRAQAKDGSCAPVSLLCRRAPSGTPMGARARPPHPYWALQTPNYQGELPGAYWHAPLHSAFDRREAPYGPKWPSTRGARGGLAKISGVAQSAP